MYFEAVKTICATVKDEPLRLLSQRQKRGG